MFAVTLARRTEMFMSVPCCWSRYDSTRLLYVPTASVFSYRTGMYMNCQDTKGLAEMSARTENTLVTRACFLASCLICSSWHFLVDLRLSQYFRGILVPFLTAVLKNREVFGFYSVTHLVGYDPVLCLLTFKSSQEVDWSYYCRIDPVLQYYDLKTGKVLNIPPLHASKRLKTGSAMVIDVPGYEAHRIHDIRFANINCCEAE